MCTKLRWKFIVQHQLHICFCTVLWLIFYGIHCLVSLASVGCVLELWISSCWLGLLVLKERRKPNLCDSKLSMPLFGVFGWSITLTSLMVGIRISRSCGIGLGVLLLIGARRMIFLEGCLSLICRDIWEHCSFDVLFLFILLFVLRISCPLISLQYPSLLVNNISSFIPQKKKNWKCRIFFSKFFLDSATQFAYF